MYRLIAPSVLLLAACGGKSINEDEAELVFYSVMAVSQDVMTQSMSQVGAAKEMTATQTDTGWEFSGTLEGGALWEGSIEVTGEVSYTQEAYAYDLSLEYIDVTVTGEDVTLNGTVDMAVDYLSDGTALHYEYGLAGDLEVTGEAKGQAEFDFNLVMDIDYTTQQYTYEASGDINGHDVSGWASSVSGAGSY